MATLVKYEHHSVTVQYATELDDSLLSEIYPDKDEDEIAQLLAEIENGEVDVEDIINDAYDNDVELEWDHQYDDMWTMRKGGYDVSFELGDESSWHTEPPPPEPTHKCTKCKWKGQSYEADYIYPEENSNDKVKKVCPYCESDIELTEAGIKEEKESAERRAKWAVEDTEDEVPCYSCGALHNENELPEMNGQYVCPSCGEGWIMMDQREDDQS